MPLAMQCCSYDITDVATSIQHAQDQQHLQQAIGQVLPLTLMLAQPAM